MSRRGNASTGSSRSTPFGEWPLWKIVGGFLGGATAILGLVLGTFQIVDAQREKEDQQAIASTPIVVNIHREVEPFCLVKRWYSTQAPTKANTPDIPVDKALRKSWTPGGDAEPIGLEFITVTVQSRTSEATVLTGFDVEVVSRADATDGAVFPEGRIDCDYLPPRQLAVNLNGDTPVLKALPELDPNGNVVKAPYGFPFTVSSTDPEQFVILPNSDSCDCRFRLILRWIAGGKDGQTVIDDGGKPFRSVGTAGARSFGYNATTEQWEACPQPRGCLASTHRTILAST